MTNGIFSYHLRNTIKVRIQLINPITHTTNCRLKRHLISTSSHEHGKPAETKPNTAIHTHHPNTREAKANQGHKLYSKVLTIEPNRLPKNLATANTGHARC
jgi:hypothetical protein